MSTKGEITRVAILEHATHEAARLGFEGLSIGGLARDLGMSKSGLFAHFESKDALCAEIIDYTADLFTEHVIRVALRSPRGEPRLRALFDLWLCWMRDRRAGEGCLFIAMAAELDDRSGPARDRLVSQQRDWLDFIGSVASAGIKEGHFREDLDGTQLAFELAGVLFSYHQSSRLLADDQAEVRARRAFERLLADSRPPTP